MRDGIEGQAQRVANEVSSERQGIDWGSMIHITVVPVLVLGVTDRDEVTKFDLLFSNSCQQRNAKRNETKSL